MEKYNTVKSVDSKKSGSQKRNKSVFHKIKKTFSSIDNYFNPSPETTSQRNITKEPSSSVHFTSRNRSVPGDSTPNGSLGYQQRSMTLQPSNSDNSEVWLRPEENQGGSRYSSYTGNSNTLAAPVGDSPRWHEGLAVYDMETLRDHEVIELGAMQYPNDTMNVGGHNFKPMYLENVTWCDYCDDHIWGGHGFRSCHRCTVCQMTCHFQCCRWVQLPCESTAQFPVSNPDQQVGNPYNSQLIDAFYKRVSQVQNGGPIVVAMRTTNILPVTPCGSPYCIHSQPGPQLHYIYHQPHTEWSQHQTPPTAITGYNNQHKDPNTTSPAINNNFLIGDDSASTLRSDTLSSYYNNSTLGSSTFSDVTLLSDPGTLLTPTRPPNSNSESTSGYFTQFNDTLEAQKMSSAGNTPYATAKSNLSVCSSDYNPTYNFNLVLGGYIYDTSTTGGSLSSSCVSDDIQTFASTSTSLSLRLGYDFSTLDKDTIERYQIRVHEEGSGSHENGDVSKVVSQGTENMQGVLQWENSIWSEVELKRKVDIFNSNDVGLVAQWPDPLSRKECEGTIRVHINLIRPIKMLLTARPPSIYDVVAATDDVDEQTMAMTSFRLPRSSTKMVHIGMSTTAQEVISNLLKKFRIKDNPHKFSLYEHTIQGEREVCVRKIAGLECPLRMLFIWTGSSGAEFNEKLKVKRLVLQENETGDIDWTAFSTPELTTFLSILKREEGEYSRQIQLKYSLIRDELSRLLQESEVPPPLPDIAGLDVLEGPLNKRQSSV